MANKLKLASERRKLSLRAVVLQNRSRVAQLQEQTKRAREELSSMTTKRPQSSATIAGLPRVKLSGVK